MSRKLQVKPTREKVELDKLKKCLITSYLNLKQVQNLLFKCSVMLQVHFLLPRIFIEIKVEHSSSWEEEKSYGSITVQQIEIRSKLIC